MSNRIEDMFDQLNLEVERYLDTTLRVFATESILKLTEAWAYLIIDLLTSNTLEPLKESTILRRKTRGENILDPDTPLIESGEWITYIEFKVRAEYDLYYLEVGVFDDSTPIGHDGGKVTPVYIAYVNEYGHMHIPARAPLAASEMEMESHLDSVISSAWANLPSGHLDKTVKAIVTRKISDSYGDFHKRGRIVKDGSRFKFRWDS